ncbi:LOW QUALITY PROTEIN: kinetochore-associated protein NSL1 homolog [Dromiciops gliroides]|uniref:LOW QUALITY PROTEIN: kinetochore-associated protein NSL1 homolog n=1 Tax=Dromiciops gliroides TaxID=33562 RepID=UPI001CC36FBD|nr:LOW QUALITY PROTEIN: kinetochore-associated protein NSL1 homolog [Dromiciops gliroides]
MAGNAECPPEQEEGGEEEKAKEKKIVATGTESEPTSSTGPVEDFRVRCASQKAVAEVLKMCGRFIRELGDVLPEENRELVLKEAQWNFVTAVQENVSFNGEAWQETSDKELPVDPKIRILEDQFDEVIVDTATKRKQYPRKIAECVIKTMKAQHEILKHYRPVVHPEEIKSDAKQDSRMEILKCRGETASKQITEVMKSLPVLIEQADGFSKVLTMQPTLQLQRLHQEVFSGSHTKEAIKPENFITQIETTPTETNAKKTTKIVMKRKKPHNSPQRKQYPLRRMRMILIHEMLLFVLEVVKGLYQ